MNTFENNLELDAVLVLASMRGGIDRFLWTARCLGIRKPDLALARAEWLKKQGTYLIAVCDRAAELESEAEDVSTG